MPFINYFQMQRLLQRWGKNKYNDGTNKRKDDNP